MILLHVTCTRILQGFEREDISEPRSRQCLIAAIFVGVPFSYVMVKTLVVTVIMYWYKKEPWFNFKAPILFVVKHVSI